MTAIIFGANGQDGFYLEKLLQQEKVNVIGVSRSGNFLRTDIKKFEEISTLIKNEQPDYIFHFAANSTTRHDALFENHEIIATGTLNILEAVKKFSPKTKIFISGSALQFLNTGKPVKETDPFIANDAYAVSRIQSVYAARYFRSLGIKVYVGYLFNHESPLRTERHISKKIVSALERIVEGSNEKIAIGDITAEKEWGFAGDVVKAIWTLVNRENTFEAVIGTGKAYSIEYWLSLCFGIRNLKWQDHVVKNDNFISPYKILVSDPSLIISLGWEPRTSIDELARIMINS